MALAIRMEKLVGEKKASDYAALASVSRPRMSQIMSLTNLAPDIQETLLFLPKTMAGPDPITERRLRYIAQTIDWSRQKELFQDQDILPNVGVLHTGLDEVATIVRPIGDFSVRASHCLFPASAVDSLAVQAVVRVSKTVKHDARPIRGPNRPKAGPRSKGER